MLLSDFLSRTLAYASVDGSPFLDATDDRENFIGEKLHEFTGRCRCIFFDDITMTLTAGTRLYRFDDYSTVFTRSGSQTSMALSKPVNVWINENALLDLKGDPGPIGSEELEDWRMSGTETGLPQRWGVHAPGTMFLWPIPSSVPTVRVSAWAHHPQVTSSTVFSTTAVSLPTDRINTAIKFAAAGLLDPLATGDGKGRANQILKEALYEMDQFNSEMADFRRSTGARGGRTRSDYRLD